MELIQPTRLKLRRESQFKNFLQQVLNRYTVGSIRYGEPDKSQCYLARLEKEIKSYKRVGNREQLINVAVYAFLEFIEPENILAHFDSTSRSVTRQFDTF